MIYWFFTSSHLQTLNSRWHRNGKILHDFCQIAAAIPHNKVHRHQNQDQRWKSKKGSVDGCWTLFHFQSNKSFSFIFLLTKAPCFKSCSQNARPNPTAAPVTIQILSLSDISQKFWHLQLIKMSNNFSSDVLRTLWEFSLFCGKRQFSLPRSAVRFWRKCV